MNPRTTLEGFTCLVVVRRFLYGFPLCNRSKWDSTGIWKTCNRNSGANNKRQIVTLHLFGVVKNFQSVIRKSIV